MTNEEHQALAAKYLAEERLYDASRELSKVDKEVLTKDEERVMEKAKKFQKYANVAKNEYDPSWTNLGESRKNGRSFSSLYKINWGPLKVNFAMELLIERSLVLPLLAVLNEVDLYNTWLPKWGKPTRLEFVRTNTLRRSGMTIQDCTIRVAAPLATVETYLRVEGVDDTVANREVTLTLNHLEVGDQEGLVPPHEEGVNRVKINAVVLYRKAPKDEELKAKALRGKKLKEDEDFVKISIVVEYGNENTMLKGGFVIRKLATFVLKIVAGMMVNRMFSLAEEVRDHKRPEYEKAMAEKPETYDWIRERISGILD